MIQFRLGTFEEKPKIQTWVKNSFGYELVLEDLVFVAEESGNIFGTCIFAYQSGAADTAIIKSIYIIPEERNQKYGDGLIRATLNYLDRQGVKTVKLVTNKFFDEFYHSEGFERVNENEFVTKMPDFFLKPCKGSEK